MLYLFHHIPKCGGSSFREFLTTVFDVKFDYFRGNHRASPEIFERFKNKPIDLQACPDKTCVCGHFNLAGARLYERYPGIEQIPHKKFSIIREPFEAAMSGLRYGIKRGFLPSNMSEAQAAEALLKRANYFSRIFEIRDAADVNALLDKYWFVAPIEHIDMAARLIEAEIGRTGAGVDVLNTTELVSIFKEPERVAAMFRERCELDYTLYEAACERFKSGFLEGAGIVPRGSS